MVSVYLEWQKINDKVYRLSSIKTESEFGYGIAKQDPVYVLGGGYISAKSLAKLTFKHKTVDLLCNPSEELLVLSGESHYSTFFDIKWFTNDIKEYFDV